MFVQQMHYYNTVIEDLPNSDSHNQETSQIDESHNDAIDKLRIYECRALNLFRYQSDAKSSILHLLIVITMVTSVSLNVILTYFDTISEMSTSSICRRLVRIVHRHQSI